MKTMLQNTIMCTIFFFRFAKSGCNQSRENHRHGKRVESAHNKIVLRMYLSRLDDSYAIVAF